MGIPAAHRHSEKRTGTLRWRRKAPNTRRSLRCATSGATKVKVAVSDIDGILRGKYLHRDKFFGAAQPRAASASATWSSAGTRARRLLRQHQVTGWQPRLFPTRWRGWTWTPRAACPGTAACPSSWASSSTPTAALPGVPAADPEARAGARREAGSAADGRHGVRVVQLRRDAAELGGQAGVGPSRSRRHVRLLAAAHGRPARLLQRADGRDAGLRRAHRRACTPRPAPASTRSPSSSARRWKRPTAPSSSRPAPRKSASASA